jgi:predicted dehydrogenase
MAETIRLGIMGAGWPGSAHAKGCQSSGGFKLVAVADLIPQRRKKLMADFGIAKEFAEAQDMLGKDAADAIDAVCICLPTHLHAPMALAALKAGKHVICEAPPAPSAKEAGQIERAAAKAGKVVLYSFQRRLGGAEQASRQAIAKGYAGNVYHVRAAWMRTRAIPVGTGWYSDKAKSGGGALIDIGLHMLDLGWDLLGQPKPGSAYAVTHRRLLETGQSEPTPTSEHAADIDEAAFALLRFEGGKSLELSSSWAINQPPQQNGTVCRVYGEGGAIEVYTPEGAVLYRSFTPEGESRSAALKGPKVVHHAAMMRHFRECILGRSTPMAGAAHGRALMEMVEAIYRSSESGKSVMLG